MRRRPRGPRDGQEAAHPAASDASHQDDRERMLTHVRRAAGRGNWTDFLESMRSHEGGAAPSALVVSAQALAFLELDRAGQAFHIIQSFASGRVDDIASIWAHTVLDLLLVAEGADLANEDARSRCAQRIFNDMVMHGRPEQARALMDSAVGTMSQPEALGRCALALGSAGDLPRSIGILRQVVASTDDNTYRLMLADHLSRAREHTDAMRVLDSAFQTDKPEPQALAVRASIHERRGDVEAAIRDFAAAVTQKPSWKWALRLAELCTENGDLDTARHWLILAQEHVPISAHTSTKERIALLEARTTPNATQRREVLVSLILSSDNWATANAATHELLRRGDTERALQALNNRRGRSPS